MNIFENASRRNLTFVIIGIAGVVSTSHLWKAKLEALDETRTTLNKAIRDADQDSLLSTKVNPKLDEDKLRVEILTHIIKDRLAEKKAKEEAVDKANRAKILRETIAAKQQDAIGAKSIEELQKELAELEG